MKTGPLVSSASDRKCFAVFYAVGRKFDGKLRPTPIFPAFAELASAPELRVKNRYVLFHFYMPILQRLITIHIAAGRDLERSTMTIR